jgi:hypothetical protein
MKTFFIVTDIEGNVLSGDIEFVSENDAIDWSKNNVKGRCFLDRVIEII